MKPKKFRDNLWPIFVGYEIFFAISALAVLCIILFSLYWHMKEPPGYTTMETILVCGSFGSLLVAVGWMFNHNLCLPRAFGRLLVYEDRVDPETFVSMGHATPFAGWQVQGDCIYTCVGGEAVWQKK